MLTKKMFYTTVMTIILTTNIQSQTCVGFKDVQSSDAICNDLIFAKESEWINGYPDGTFRPKNSVNRAEFTKIVMNAIYKRELESKNCFYNSAINEYEIKSDMWYSSYVCSAKEKNIIKGRGDGLFHPDETINYVESLKIILRALGFKANEDNYSNWYTPYLNEAEAMELDIYDTTHIMSRGEMISLIHNAYSKHTKRALVTDNWKKACYAKNYHFYKMDKKPTCKDKWAMQMFYELGVPNINTQTSLIKTDMNSIQDTHDIAMNVFKSLGYLVNLGSSAKNNLIALQLESIKTLSSISFGENGSAVANITGNIFDIGLSFMQENINNVLNEAKGIINPTPAMYFAFGFKLGEMGTDVLGAFSLDRKTKELNNLNIALAYLNDFYQYGGDNGKVAVNEAKIDADANMYDTIWHYATNKGYKDLWWSSEFDFSEIVGIVEKVKRGVNQAVQTCYVERECLSQTQKDLLPNFNIFTVDGKKTIKILGE